MAGQKAALGQTTESLALQQCLQFSGPIASGGAQAQPFHMDVAARVGALCHVRLTAPLACRVRMTPPLADDANNEMPGHGLRRGCNGQQHACMQAQHLACLAAARLTTACVPGPTSGPSEMHGLCWRCTCA